MDPYVKSGSSVDDEPDFAFWMHSSRSQIPSNTPSGFDSLDDLATTQAKSSLLRWYDALVPLFLELRSPFCS